MVEIRRLDTSETRKLIAPLGELLVDCVAGGASVSFLSPFTQQQAEKYFHSLLPQLQSADRHLFGAFAGKQLVGSVQLVISMPPNQPHRGEIAKLLVLSSARKHGVATLLMKHAEAAARDLGKTLLVLDTVTGGHAERLYARLGWTQAGTIPNYALLPDGQLCATTIFWKQLDGAI